MWNAFVYWKHVHVHVGSRQKLRLCQRAALGRQIHPTPAPNLRPMPTCVCPRGRPVQAWWLARSHQGWKRCTEAGAVGSEQKGCDSWCWQVAMWLSLGVVGAWPPLWSFKPYGCTWHSQCCLSEDLLRLHKLFLFRVLWLHLCILHTPLNWLGRWRCCSKCFPVIIYWAAAMSMTPWLALFIIMSFNFHGNLCASHYFTVEPWLCFPWRRETTLIHSVVSSIVARS